MININNFKGRMSTKPKVLITFHPADRAYYDNVILPKFNHLDLVLSSTPIMTKEEYSKDILYSLFFLFFSFLFLFYLFFFFPSFFFFFLASFLFSPSPLSILIIVPLMDKEVLKELQHWFMLQLSFLWMRRQLIICLLLLKLSPTTVQGMFKLILIIIINLQIQI